MLFNMREILDSKDVQMIFWPIVFKWFLEKIDFQINAEFDLQLFLYLNEKIDKLNENLEKCIYLY